MFSLTCPHVLPCPCVLLYHSLLYFYMIVRGGLKGGNMTCLWRSKDNFWELLLTCHLVKAGSCFCMLAGQRISWQSPASATYLTIAVLELKMLAHHHISFIWVPEIRLSFSGLCSKHFYSLSHITSPFSSPFALFFDKVYLVSAVESRQRWRWSSDTFLFSCSSVG